MLSLCIKILRIIKSATLDTTNEADRSKAKASVIFPPQQIQGYPNKNTTITEKVVQKKYLIEFRASWVL